MWGACREWSVLCISSCLDNNVKVWNRNIAWTSRSLLTFIILCLCRFSQHNLPKMCGMLLFLTINSLCHIVWYRNNYCKTYWHIFQSNNCKLGTINVQFIGIYVNHVITTIIIITTTYTISLAMNTIIACNEIVYFSTSTESV